MVGIPISRPSYIHGDNILLSIILENYGQGHCLHPGEVSTDFCKNWWVHVHWWHLVCGASEVLHRNEMYVIVSRLWKYTTKMRSLDWLLHWRSMRALSSTISSKITILIQSLTDYGYNDIYFSTKVCHSFKASRVLSLKQWSMLSMPTQKSKTWILMWLCIIWVKW